MKILFFLLLLCNFAFADESTDWQAQSYKQSKHLPDLHHAVDVKLLDEMQPPAEFVLKEDRKIGCKTCHGLEKIEETPYDKIDKNAPDFLRKDGYKKLETFCANCHDKKAHERPNIHLMLNDDGTIKKENCLFCHNEVNESREKLRPLVDTHLRLPPEKVCLGCHLKTPHFNAVEHTDANLKTLENSKSSARNMKTQLLETEKEQGVHLPLSENDEVLLCLTCHSPHAKGVLGEKNPASNQVNGDIKKGVEYEKHSWNDVMEADKRERLEKIGDVLPPYQRLKNEVLLRLPAKDGTLCLSCHEFEN
jgi:nitrate/TMAO reductase-like tetraheme cytochrome c subunit